MFPKKAMRYVFAEGRRPLTSERTPLWSTLPESIVHFSDDTYCRKSFVLSLRSRATNAQYYIASTFVQGL